MRVTRTTAIVMLLSACVLLAFWAPRAFAVSRSYGDGCGLDVYSTLPQAIDCLAFDAGEGNMPEYDLIARVTDGGSLVGYEWSGRATGSYASDTDARSALAAAVPAGVDPSEWLSYVNGLEFDPGTGHTADGYPTGDDSLGYYTFADSSDPGTYSVDATTGQWVGFDAPTPPPDTTTVVLASGDRQALDLTWFGIWLLGGIFFGLWLFRRLGREARGWGMGA